MADTALKVTIGEKTYPFKKINMTIIKEHLELLKKNARLHASGQQPDAGDIFDSFLEMTQIIHKCIIRAQPDVTIEQVMDDLDLENISETFGRIMRGGDFVPMGEKLPAVA